MRALVCLSFSGLRRRPDVGISSDIFLSCGNGFITVQTIMSDAWLEIRNVHSDDGLPVLLQARLCLCFFFFFSFLHHGPHLSN